MRDETKKFRGHFSGRCSFVCMKSLANTQTPKRINLGHYGGCGWLASSLATKGRSADCTCVWSPAFVKAVPAYCGWSTRMGKLTSRSVHVAIEHANCNDNARPVNGASVLKLRLNMLARRSQGTVVVSREHTDKAHTSSKDLVLLFVSRFKLMDMGGGYGDQAICLALVVRAPTRSAPELED